MALGRADLPIAADQAMSPAANNLGLLGYAKALAKFIAECETPMTVGIQGEWVSGKTSLMNMVKRELQGLNPDAISETFETWAYGATGADEGLGFQLLTTITDRLASRGKSNAAVLRLASKIGKVSAVMRRGLLATGRGLGAGFLSGVGGPFFDGRDAVNGFLDGFRGENEPQEMGLAKLREEFSSLVKEVVPPASELGRVVVFIDDLDRIRPGAAVTLLEVLKNFMDVGRCVFVVACDYEVVRLGVREKFGIEEDKKVRAFFDKIIQVPFQMPVHNYRLETLVSAFIQDRIPGGGTWVGRERAEELASDVGSLIGTAIGTNPRAVKRFLNVLDLLTCVNAGDEDGSPWSDDTSLRILLALVALQSRWPQVAAQLSAIDAADQLVAKLDLLGSDPNGERHEERSALLRELMGTNGASSDPGELDDLSDFMTDFWKLLDENEDGQLTAKEIEPLQSWASKLRLTGVGRKTTARDVGESFAERVRKAIPRSAGEYLRLTKLAYES